MKYSYRSLISLFIILFSMPGFALERINMTRSTSVLLELHQNEHLSFQLYNFSLPTGQQVWGYYCHLFPEHSRAFIYGIKKNGPSEYQPLQTSAIRFDYFIDNTEASWQTLNFELLYKGVEPFKTSLICWINGDLNPVQIDKRPRPVLAVQVPVVISKPNEVPSKSKSQELTRLSQEATLEKNIREKIIWLTQHITQLEVSNIHELELIERTFDETYPQLNGLPLTSKNKLYTELEQLKETYMNLIKRPDDIETTPPVEQPPKEKELDWSLFPMLTNSQGNPFKKPVIIATPRAKEYFGVTIDEHELPEIQKKYPFFPLTTYPNLALQDIIALIIQHKDPEKCKKEISHEITDHITEDVLADPFTFPEGQSVNNITLSQIRPLMNPFARGALNPSLIPNSNLKEFVFNFKHFIETDATAESIQH